MRELFRNSMYTQGLNIMEKLYIYIYIYIYIIYIHNWTTAESKVSQYTGTAYVRDADACALVVLL